MGMFSWKTADTKESVWVTGTEYFDADKTAFLLQPNGEQPIPESDYDGYGMFGDVDAYAWLAKTNLPALGVSAEQIDSIPMDKLRVIGIQMDAISESIDSGSVYCHYPEGLGQLLQSYGLHSEGVDIKSDTTIPFPIKISFNHDAEYESLDASESCPYQGFLTYDYEQDLAEDDPFVIPDDDEEDEFNLN